ncbi:putative addiction module antidote protein [Pseudomonas protegens]|jgi:probable addiction module antidote protein|uniref:Addiction module antidote protein n=2 Tax=Pseudomonas protegens TaxID=380021 RepID=A0ABY2V9U1_9PSED|nr:MULTISPECIES: addiction module antidote protein [Pseudomonas]AAY96059.1 putative addiction module antidote protein [Pseudomonas protegens Pf-5]APC20068.1 putative addiction module antidote protein [Pseudomonas protegens]ASE19812.1 putative addiction module antidote protein [Pseudomonas protegens]MBF0639588.1 putative addiction module antidote protein [Pseudomonas protegens]MBP5095183.1 putative addiction module antidote protein [Pseudomonas protegens]
MRTPVTRFDAAEYLKTPEDMVAYLDACFEEDTGDGVLIRAALNDIARARGMTQVARDTGLGRESLYKALGSQGNPEFATIIKVMKALGLKINVSNA